MDRFEAIRHLREQVYFLDQGNAGYDRGVDAEAKAIAVRLRILFHSTSSSHALVDQVGIRDEMEMYDTAEPLSPQGESTGYSALALMPLSRRGGVRGYVPRLDTNRDAAFGFVGVEDWWQRPVIVDPAGQTLTRESLVLAMANQDGGAHVDPNINEVYACLRDSGVGLELRQPGKEYAPATPIYASVRQCSHETLVSLAHSFPQAFPPEVHRRRYTYLPGPDPREVYGGDVFIRGFTTEGGEGNARWPAKIGRNDPCPCGSGKKFKRCHGC
jgi:SEC-C motif